MPIGAGIGLSAGACLVSRIFSGRVSVVAPGIQGRSRRALAIVLTFNRCAVRRIRIWMVGRRPEEIACGRENKTEEVPLHSHRQISWQAVGYTVRYRSECAKASLVWPAMGPGHSASSFQG